jgi:hypothetical protein
MQCAVPCRAAECAFCCFTLERVGQTALSTYVSGYTYFRSGMRKVCGLGNSALSEVVTTRMGCAENRVRLEIVTEHEPEGHSTVCSVFVTRIMM